MADLAQVIATGGTALVSAAAGAGLTYWLGALNRRHQEAREDRTRWYEKRLQAYTELSAIAFQGLALTAENIEDAEYKEHVAHLGELVRAVSLVRLVGSPEVLERAVQVMDVVSEMVANHDRSLGQAYKEAVNALRRLLAKTSATLEPSLSEPLHRKRVVVMFADE
jgi:hypothetical protein